jgi:exodeoxyribonuclease V alpha subunit
MSSQRRLELVGGRGSTDTASTSLIVQDASGLLAVFNQAGVLNPADVHSAATVCRIGGEAKRATCAGVDRPGAPQWISLHDLRTVHATAFDEAESAIDVAELPWPEPEWLAGL